MKGIIPLLTFLLQLVEILLKNLELIKLISNTAVYLSEGEVLQLLHHKWDNTSIIKYLKIIKCKSACLMAASMQAGAIFANQPKQTIREIYTCGEQIGMAFQIVDDVLDYSSKKTGKELGVDLKEKKITLPLCILMNLLETKEKQTMLKLLESPKITTKQIQDIIEKMQHFGVFDDSIQRATKYIQNAKKFLKTLPDNLYREKLLELADFTLTRNH